MLELVSSPSAFACEAAVSIATAHATCNQRDPVAIALAPNSSTMSMRF
jgi:hypothetical protein